MTGNVTMTAWLTRSNGLHRAHIYGELRFISHEIKAWMIAGLPAELIARYYNCPVDCIRAYLMLFFDIEPYQHDRTVIRSVIFNCRQNENMNAVELRERLYTTSAFHLKEKGFKLASGFDMLGHSEEEMDKICEWNKKMLCQQSFLFNLLNSADPVPRANHHERYIEMFDVTSRAEQNRPKDNNRLREWENATTNVFREKVVRDGIKSPKLQELIEKEKMIEIESQLMEGRPDEFVPVLPDSSSKKAVQPSFNIINFSEDGSSLS